MNPAVIPTSKLKNIQVRIVFIACIFLFSANFFDLFTVIAIFKVEF